MFLGAEDRSKAQALSSDDDQLSLAVYVEHSPDLEPRSDGCTGGVDNQVPYVPFVPFVPFVLLMLCCESLSVNPLTTIVVIETWAHVIRWRNPF